jgi:hypothetical protein
MPDYPAHIEADLMAGLGTVVSQWAYIDYLMGEFVAFLVDGNPALMYVITNNVSASTLADWARTLLPVKYQADESIDEIRSLLGEIDRLRAERNALAHGLWSPHVPGSANVQTVRWERSEVIKIELVTVRDLEELAHDIDEAGNALAALGRRLGFPKMPKKVRHAVEKEVRRRRSNYKSSGSSSQQKPKSSRDTTC